MLVLKQEQRAFVAEALKDLANLAVGAMAFGPCISDRPFEVRIFVTGFALWLFLVLCAVAVKGVRK